jgi:hypothetical protein
MGVGGRARIGSFSTVDPATEQALIAELDNDQGRVRGGTKLNGCVGPEAVIPRISAHRFSGLAAQLCSQPPDIHLCSSVQIRFGETGYDSNSLSGGADVFLPNAATRSVAWWNVAMRRPKPSASQSAKSSEHLHPTRHLFPKLRLCPILKASCSSLRPARARPAVRRRGPRPRPLRPHQDLGAASCCP